MNTSQDLGNTTEIANTYCESRGSIVIIAENSGLWEKILESRNIFRKFSDKKAVVCISGGKDSLVLMDIALSLASNHSNITFVYCETTMSLPGTEQYIRELELFYGVDVVTVRPPRPFFSLVKDIGFPSRRFRWCCEVFKFGPVTSFILRENIKLVFTGMRAEESIKRRSYQIESRNPLIPAKQINPLLNWTKDDIWDYIRHKKLRYNKNYDKGFTRLGCWPCPFKTKDEWANLTKEYPELMEKLVQTLKETIEKQNLNYVQNIDDYIHSFDWTTNLPTQKNEIVGELHPLDDNSIRLEMEQPDQIDLVEPYLFLLGKRNHYKKSENSIEFRNDTELSLKQVCILLEKAIMCVGCGACVSLCPTGALFIEDGTWSIHKDQCKLCHHCISTGSLRGACTARNYKHERKRIRITPDKEENYISSVISDEERKALIRTRKPKKAVSKLLSEIAVYEKIGKGEFFVNRRFNILMNKKKGLLELVIFPKEAKLGDCVNEVLDLIKAV